MQQAASGLLKEPLKKLSAAKLNPGARTRPTNNQLLYRATFQWEHYRQALDGEVNLPEATQACASVTSAFLQVVGVLFQVEMLRVDQPRNILRLLSTNTRRTKVVELSSGTHRVPDELKRHSIGDKEGGQYSTNLDRNRYGSDDQYLATVVRYNLEFLDLCPCLVDITILDAKAGEVSTVVSAGPAGCICKGRPQQADGKPQRMIRTVSNRDPDPESEERGLTPPDPVRDQQQTGPSDGPPVAGGSRAGGPFKAVERVVEPAAPSKSNGGSDLFDTLVMAAMEPQATSPLANQKQAPRGLASRSPNVENDSSDGSADKAAAEGRGRGEGLRRSSRKSVKLFSAAALEREGSIESEGGSVHSMEGNTETITARGGQLEEWDGFAGSRSRRASLPPRGASAANLAKLNWAGRAYPDGRRLRPQDDQQELRRLQQQLQTTGMMLEESRESEAQYRSQVQRLEEELAAQQSVFQNNRDQEEAGKQVANLKAEVQLLVTAGAKAGAKGGSSSNVPPDISVNMLATMLKEAQETISKLEQEKALLCNALSAAGIQSPPLPSPREVGTPHRNGERPVNGGFPPSLHLAAGASAFSVPLGFQSFQNFPHSSQQLPSGLAGQTGHSLFGNLVHGGQIPQIVASAGCGTPRRLQPAPAPQTPLWQGHTQDGHHLQPRLSAEGGGGRSQEGAPPDGSRGSAPPEGRSLSMKRKPEEAA